MRLLANALLLLGSVQVHALASLFDCEANPTTQCDLVCANCADPTVDCTTLGTKNIDCGTVTAGLSTEDAAWATTGYCYKFSSTKFDMDDRCDTWTYVGLGGPIVCFSIAGLAVLFCIIFPIARACCGCCGGETVNTDNCCHGQSWESSCACCTDPNDEERMSGAAYFKGSCCDVCNCINPCHPTGARYTYPIIVLVLSIASLVMCVVWAKEVEDNVDSVLDAGVEAIDTTLRANLNNASLELGLAETTCTACTSTTACSNFSAALSAMDQTITLSKETLREVKDKDAAKAARDIIAVLGYVLGSIPITSAVLALIFGVCRCSRLGGSCGNHDCCGGCFVWFTMIWTLTLLAACTVLLAFVAAASDATMDYCDEISYLKLSPPNITGALGAKYLADACQYTKFKVDIASLGTVTACTPFDNAIEVLSGNPRKFSGTLRGSLYEGIVSCPRLVLNVGLALDTKCGSLQDGIDGMTWAIAVMTAAMVGCVLIMWLGIKRWISEEDVKEGSGEPYGEDPENAKKRPAGIEGLPGPVKCLCCPCLLSWLSLKKLCCPCLGTCCDRMWSCCFCKCCEYTDSSFPPEPATLGGKDAQDTSITWTRASQMQEGMCLFQGEIEPGDIQQGGLGNCWLMSSFACLAEYPGALQNMFDQRETSQRGKYTITLYENGRPKEVTIDDFIPCKYGKNPKYAQPNGPEMWVMLLEKAVAKSYGSYEAIVGGNVMKGLAMLTGDPAFRLDREDSGSWGRCDVAYTGKSGKDQFTLKYSPHKIEKDKLFDVIFEYKKKEALLGASGHGQMTKGLVGSHAYTILDARDVGGFKLIKLRNPWGRGEWEGRWSDKSPLWNENKSVASSVGKTDGDDGMFWMQFEDFITYFDAIDVLDRSTGEHDFAFRTYEGEGCCGPCTGCCKGCCSLWCCCKGAKVLCCSRKGTGEMRKGERECCDG
eukprot:Hpha_TRINITY_DN14485_c3_g1::TRINITY_DN14485_c3_g1_i1::g.157968::m.157968/K08582/CAPN15; calpain-15